MSPNTAINVTIGDLTAAIEQIQGWLQDVATVLSCIDPDQSIAVNGDALQQTLYMPNRYTGCPAPRPEAGKYYFVRCPEPPDRKGDTIYPAD